MRRQILTYLPANIVPALLSLAQIYAFTRLLGVEAYGDYSLAFTVVIMAQAVVFMPLHSSAVRLYSVSEREGRTASFVRTTYEGVLLLGLAVATLALLVLLVTGGALGWAVSWAMVLALPLLLARSLVQVGQGLNRMRDQSVAYCAIECGHAVLSLAFGVALLAVLGRDGPAASAGAMAGMAVAAALCAAAAVAGHAALIRDGAFDRGYALDMLRFAAPLTLVLLTTTLLQYADRFVLGSFSGAAAVGIYAVAFALAERPTTVLSLSVATATYPLAVRALEREGREAGRRQAGRNGAVLIAVLTPACLGLAMSAHEVAAVLIGPDYREGAAALLPIMAYRALARCLSTHFVEHSFHLARRPDALLRISGPASVANIALDLATIPFFGVLGAAWSALACQLGALLACWVVARRLLPLWLPWRDVAGVGVATAAMALALHEVHVPATVAGLAVKVAIGTGAYGAVTLAWHARRLWQLRAAAPVAVGR